jgi:hypothetical protein
MIKQYLPNSNETATVAFRQKILPTKQPLAAVQCAVPESAALHLHSMSPSPWRDLLQPFTPAVLDPFFLPGEGRGLRPPARLPVQPVYSSHRSKLQLFGLTRPVVCTTNTSGLRGPSQDRKRFCHSVQYSYYMHLFCFRQRFLNTRFQC